MGRLYQISWRVEMSSISLGGRWCPSLDESIRAQGRNVSGTPLYHASSSDSSLYHRSRRTCCETAKGPGTGRWSVRCTLSPELMKLTILDTIQTSPLLIRSSFITSSPSGYPAAPVLLGRTKPPLSMSRPASVHRTVSSVFSLVWLSLITTLCQRRLEGIIYWGEKHLQAAK